MRLKRALMRFCVLGWTARAIQLLTTEEAARRLSLTPETVRRFLRSGELRGVKVGRVH